MSPHLLAGYRPLMRYGFMSAGFLRTMASVVFWGYTVLEFRKALRGALTWSKIPRKSQRNICSADRVCLTAGVIECKA